MVREDPIIFVIEGDVGSTEETLDRVDNRIENTHRDLTILWREMEQQKADLEELKREITQTAIEATTLVALTFGIVKNLMRIFGISLSQMQAATLDVIQTVIVTYFRTRAAISLYRLGMLGPAGMAMAPLEVASAAMSILMMISAKAEAAQQFAEINARITAAQNILEIAAR